MSIYCATEFYDYASGDWWFENICDEKPLDTKRSRKCCSCKTKIMPGEIARKIPRFRPPTEFEEIRGIYREDDEVPMVPRYFCETCGDLAESLEELGYCYSIGGQSLKQQIAEYRADNQPVSTPYTALISNQPPTTQQKGE